MLLDVLANAGQLFLERHADLRQDIWPAEARELKDLWALKRPVQRSAIHHFRGERDTYPAQRMTSRPAFTIKTLPLVSSVNSTPVATCGAVEPPWKSTFVT